MKKLIIITLAAVAVVGCMPNDENKSVSRQDSVIKAVDTRSDGVSLQLEGNAYDASKLPDTLKCTMVNSTHDTITTGYWYRIDKLSGDQWKPVSPEDLVFAEIAFLLESGQSKTFDVSLMQKSIAYSAGKYRVVKYYLRSNKSNGEKTELFAEFTIK